MTDAKRADLVVCQLTREFSTAGGPLPILQGIDVTLARGDALAVTGPSGSGKSTFLYIVGVLDQPTSGSVEILGRNPFAMNRSQQAAFRNAHIGFVFQDHHLLPQCSVLENVLLPTLAGSGAGPQEEERAKSLLARVGLGDRLVHRPAQLSGGERQRVAVCRALINEPELLLADEPTGNLDQRTAETVGTLLLELSREHGTLLICVTHSEELADRFPGRMQLEAGRFVDRSADRIRHPRVTLHRTGRDTADPDLIPKSPTPHERRTPRRIVRSGSSRPSAARRAVPRAVRIGRGPVPPRRRPTTQADRFTRPGHRSGGDAGTRYGRRPRVRRGPSGTASRGEGLHGQHAHRLHRRVPGPRSVLPDRRRLPGRPAELAREPDRILELATVVAVNRGDVPLPTWESLADQLGETARNRIRLVTMPGIDLSSTAIREAVGNDRSIRFQVPRAVEVYIRQHRLYVD